MSQTAPRPAVQIVEFQPEFAASFATLNRAWIERDFRLEPPDEVVLADPRGQIIDRGGQVFFALAEREAVGTCALIPHGPSTFELAKMAVAEQLRGHGIGDQLLVAAIAWAEKAGARRLVLASSSRLVPAIRLYRKHGFQHIPVSPDNEYARADVEMELNLGGQGMFDK
jgi:GNAT superfamily N-acetyltransferase